MEKNIKLIAVDLDGTILEYNFPVHPENLAALAEAKERGCVLTVATGRSFYAIPPQVRALRSFEYFINAGGAVISAGPEGKVLWERPLPRELALRAADVALKAGAALNINFSGYEYFDIRGLMLIRGSAKKADASIGFFKLIKALREVFRLTLSSKWKLLRTKELVYKIVCMFKTASAQALAEELKKVDGLEIVVTSEKELEITAAGVNKGSALAWLGGHLGIDREQTAAIGDSGNDLPMREAAGLLVAMENGCEELKNAADIIAPPLNQNGAAKVLGEIVNGK